MPQTRLYPVGAEVMLDGGTHFRVWAPWRSKVAVVLEHPDEKPVAMDLKSETEGYFSGLVGQAKAGTLYRFRLDAEIPHRADENGGPAPPPGAHEKRITR